MLRHLFATWLIICTLGYGSAWAFDGHTDEPAQQESLNIDLNLNTDIDSQVSCDHCCHAAAHMTGIWSTTATLSDFPGVNTDSWLYRQSYRSRQPEPLQIPPIS